MITIFKGFSYLFSSAASLVCFFLKPILNQFIWIRELSAHSEIFEILKPLQLSVKKIEIKAKRNFNFCTAPMILILLQSF